MTREESCLAFYAKALEELGVHEIAGPEANQRIVEYAKITTLKATSDEVAWCSSFCNWVVNEVGYKPTYSAAAISWERWGVELEDPIKGCICIIPRYSADNPNSRHVFFCDHPDISNGIIRGVGGNQGPDGAVSISRFKVEGAKFRSPI